ncbi:DNA polymerase beta superfamily protein [Bacillus sp. FJAT-45350]|uniref:DNA polymerase beta superfamily protein n=1 Tax=Bacillus sp. FJAT-45350 TaxID=2011014 RepID=UPI000BB8E3F4|nr:nucleotidyltransferase domain-containing protein [Bacillus sp. FJAT-45350]
MDRDVAFEVVVGSQNYNLQDEHSDKDYKRFLLPTFQDLYDQKYYKSSMTSSEMDIEIHDIRKLDLLFWKANVNFLEVLFSEEIVFPNDKEYYLAISKNISELFSLKNEISIMNLPYLYHACFGMYETKKKQLQRDVEQGLKSSASKHMLTSYRILDFLTRFADNDFSNFKQAIYYHDNERKELLQFKNEPFVMEQWENRIKLKYKETAQLRATYLSHSPNEQTRKKVKCLLYSIVYNYTRYQLNRR